MSGGSGEILKISGAGNPEFSKRKQLQIQSLDPGAQPDTLSPETETAKLLTAAAAVKTDLKSRVETIPTKKKTEPFRCKT